MPGAGAVVTREEEMTQDGETRERKMNSVPLSHKPHPAWERALGEGTFGGEEPHRLPARTQVTHQEGGFRMTIRFNVLSPILCIVFCGTGVRVRPRQGEGGASARVAALRAATPASDLQAATPASDLQAATPASDL